MRVCLVETENFPWTENDLIRDANGAIFDLNYKKDIKDWFPTALAIHRHTVIMEEMVKQNKGGVRRWPKEEQIKFNKNKRALQEELALLSHKRGGLS